MKSNKTNTTWNKAEWRRLHAEYLRTPEWAKVKKLVIERDGRCQRCRKPYSPGEEFDIHHKHYRFWREANWEEVDSCELLCRVCHCMVTFGMTPMQRIDANLERLLCDVECVRNFKGFS